MRRRCWFALIGLQLFATAAAADGGRLLLREVRGERVVNLLAAPTPLRAGAAAFDVLVQARATDAPLPLQRARLRLTGPELCGSTEVVAVPERSGNRLFLGATANLPLPGTWVVEVLLDDPTDSESYRTEISVAPALPPLRKFWPYLAATPLGIALIGIHQALQLGRGRARRKH